MNPEAEQFGAVVLKSRSLAADVFEREAARIPVTPRRLQTTMPRPWAPDVRQADQADRPIVSADEHDLDATVVDGSFSFKTLAPRFDRLGVHLGRAAWANVVELHSADMPTLATVFPTSIDDVARVVARWPATESVHVSSEGLTVFDSAGGQTHWWNVPTGLKVFRTWATPRFDASVSSAGRITKRLLDILGGPERSRTATHPEMILLFDEVSKAASRSIRADLLYGKLKKFHQNHDVPTKNVLTYWLQRGVLAVGLQVYCDECGQENWYALDELSERLRCTRCLEHFTFPGVSPNKKSGWAYRPLGPFSVEGHAHGAFTVAATIRLLQSYGSGRTTWVPSVELRSPGGIHLEVDFALF